MNAEFTILLISCCIVLVIVIRNMIKSHRCPKCKSRMVAKRPIPGFRESYYNKCTKCNYTN